ncbi:YqzL family protein [Cerasibacillus terrae]|uniref:YqzL family protein n=1 Tax=Cerasibacillus terrae TaxID=2498845 RepID=A0A5C8P3X1_9BACI|nr:YqzL family protein [Cerasibacillus terrae]TXL68004.1 YqzL family protein [Cerasibacillus terrae]
MIDITWNLFSKTGDIETYLLLKQIEEDSLQRDDVETYTEIEKNE